MAPVHPLSIQIYSARKFPPVEAQLATAARAGFDTIETFGPFYEDPRAMRRLLDAHGLRARSGHFSLALAEEESDRALEIADILGIETIVVPWIAPDQRPRDAKGWADLGARLARIGGWFAAKRRRFAWHNHDFEFAALPDGSLPIEHILGEHLLWEADVAWIVRAGVDPKPWIARYAGRMPLVHVKDIAPDGQRVNEDGWADVGAGVVPWAQLWPLCVASGAEIMIAEHDNPSDFDRFARVSAGSMRRYATGEKQ
jgi:sugar phosphate isomerase/epimerase